MSEKETQRIDMNLLTYLIKEVEKKLKFETSKPNSNVHNYSYRTLREGEIIEY